MLNIRRGLGLWLLLTPGLVLARDLFVGPGGNDGSAGTREQPLATLGRARDMAREGVARGEAVTVYLREGTYYLSEPLVFKPADSGTKAAPVVYQNFGKEQAVISGGAKLKLDWEPYRDGIMRARVPTGLVTDQLFVNGERQHLARYPNFNPEVRIYNGYAADAFSAERARRWANPKGGFMHAMHEAMWGGFHYVITGKEANGKLTYEGGWQNNRPAGMHRQYRFVENIFEELDTPGEWFLESTGNTLYYTPPIGLDLTKAVIEVVRLKHLVEFRGSEASPVRNITFKGITFRHAGRTFMENREPLLRSDWTTYRGGAIFFEGAEDCALDDCFIDQVGGNAVFVNNYNRQIVIRGCEIAKAGANGVAFVGDREAGRVPKDWKDRSQNLANLDRTPGPKSPNYPVGCTVEDCLIYLSGRVEKQTAPVQIELAQGITVRHCSIYDVPRAGINIGDGCWGGHIIEFCDIFDTVKETGDHGSFNSWGRDRFWNLSGLNLNDDKVWVAEKGLPLLDAMKTVVLRNNRWRCDHGWDIDLDDGSSNYEIRNNLCLNGGIKNREGFYRVVENNVIINNGFHPHVWYKHSEDIVRRNIMCTDHYLPAGGMPSSAWGKEMDYNFVHWPGVTEPKPAARLAQQSKRDEHSVMADAMFVDPERGDFRVKEGSPALKLGFVNFMMDQFGVQKPELKAIARTPVIPKLKTEIASTPGKPAVKRPNYLWQAQVRNISGLGDRSAYGLPEEHGVLFMKVIAGTTTAGAGLQKDDVILGCNGKAVRNVAEMLALQNEAAGKSLKCDVRRAQATILVTVSNYTFCTSSEKTWAHTVSTRLAPEADLLTGKISVNHAESVHNEPLSVLTDGLVASNYGPVFGNGVLDGCYKLDLGEVKSIGRVVTRSFNQNRNRGRQHFVLYGSEASSDPGWNLENTGAFKPIMEVDSGGPAQEEFVTTIILRSDGKPLGNYRWLVWAVSPVTSAAGGENTSFQELQVFEAR